MTRRVGVPGGSVTVKYAFIDCRRVWQPTAVRAYNYTDAYTVVTEGDKTVARRVLERCNESRDGAAWAAGAALTNAEKLALMQTD